MAGEPHSPSIEGKIQKAKEYSCDSQNGCRDVGINQRDQVMEQKPALVWLDASLGFAPVLEHS